MAFIHRGQGRPVKPPLIDCKVKKPPSVSSSASSAALSSRVWNRLTGVSRPGEGDAIGRRHQQQAAGPQHSGAFGYELWLIPQVLDDLEVHHNVN